MISPRIRRIEDALDFVIERHPEIYDQAVLQPTLQNWFVGKLMQALAGPTDIKDVQKVVAEKFRFASRPKTSGFGWNPRPVVKAANRDFPATDRSAGVSKITEGEVVDQAAFPDRLGDEFEGSQPDLVGSGLGRDDLRDSACHQETSDLEPSHAVEDQPPPVEAGYDMAQWASSKYFMGYDNYAQEFVVPLERYADWGAWLAERYVRGDTASQPPTWAIPTKGNFVVFEKPSLHPTE